MNGFQLCTYARFLIDAYGDPKWNDVTILSYVNDGIRSINHLLAAKKSNVILKKATLTTVANTQTYQLNSSGFITDNDYFRVYKLTNPNAAYGLSATLPYPPNPDIPEVMPGEHHVKPYPWFYIYNNYVYLGPTPTEAQSLEFWYFYKLADITLSGTPSWMPETYHNVLSYYAALRMAAQDKQEREQVKADYYEKLQEYMSYVFGNRPNEIQYLPAGDTWNY